jgi:hypothetical protein
MAGPIIALKILAKAALKSTAKAAAKAGVKSTAKKAVKGTIKDKIRGKVKDKIKSKFKKKKLKGKDIADRMFGGGEEGGGAIVASPGGSLVSAPGGALTPAIPEKGGALVAKSSVAKELGLSPFMDSLTSIHTNVDAIKAALNDNNKDAKDRIEDQRLLNDKLNKEKREAALESKKGGIGKKLMKPGKDMADNFLSKIIKFFAMTLLGSFITALMGGARDIILAFRIGFELIKKGFPKLLKGVKALQTGIGKSLKLALKPFKIVGKAVFNAFKSLGDKIFGWVGKSIKNITEGIKNFGKNVIQTGGKVVKNVVNFAAKKLPKTAKMISQGGQLLKTQASKAKDFVKNTASKAKGLAKTGVSKVKTAAKPLVSKIGKVIGKLFGKQAGKAAAGPGIKTLFKSMAKGAKAIKIPVVGPLLVALMSMFAGDPMKQTLFKTAGAAIGGGLGLALGPIGMIVGEIAGEFVGDVLYTGFSGEAGGWSAAGKKLKDKFMQILEGGKKVGKWLLNSIKRIGWGGLGTLLNPLAGLDKKFKVVKEGFFPPAEMAESKSNTDADDVSESASYEDGGDGTTVVIDGRKGDQASATPGGGGGEEVALIIGESQDPLNILTNATLYKV